MTALRAGDKAPDFALPADNTTEIKLSSLRGKHVIVYFYPKDDTPGCTTEACDFRDNLPKFEKLDAAVIGISKDNPAKHGKFRQKYDLNFTLASDEDGKVIQAYGAWVEKSMYGKKYMGIDRSTFLIGPDGRIAHIWRGVKVKGHVAEIMEILGKTAKAA